MASPRRWAFVVVAQSGALPANSTSTTANADALFIEACGRDLVNHSDRCEVVNPARAERWTTAAQAYTAVFQADPSARSAARVAFRAAFALKQVGRFTDAIATYETLIAQYGKDSILDALVKGAPRTPPDPVEYQEERR